MPANLDNVVTAPGRVRTFLEKPSHTLPFSCVLRKYHNNLGKFLAICANDLKQGAGVKVVLDDFQPRSRLSVGWWFYLSPDHPDYKYLTPLQKQYLNCLDSPSDIYQVQDTLLGEHGIVEAWKYLIDTYTPVTFDLSLLRPAGTVNEVGLKASGPIGCGTKGEQSFFSVFFAISQHLKEGGISSFLHLLGVLNDCIRRGGIKKAIICSSLRYDSPVIRDYINTHNILGNHKKAYRIDSNLLSSPALVSAIAESVESEGAFLEKIVDDNLYANVCQGIKIPDNGTCLLWRVNLGGLPCIQDITNAFVFATSQLVKLHCTWREQVGDRAKSVAPLSEDRQVALDLLGLASLLAIEGISYRQLTAALNRYNNNIDISTFSKADFLVAQLASAYQVSRYIADQICDSLDAPRLDRIHTIEPSQRHFMDCFDREGFTTTRGIYPPYHRSITRASESEKVRHIQFHPNVETAESVTPEGWQNFFCEFKKFIDLVGRSHGFMSFDSYLPITPNWIQWFLQESPLESLYYPEASRYQKQYLQKKVAVCDLGIDREECSTCAE